MKIDEFQFGFQRKTSTTMSTWLAVETIDYFLRNGSDVFTCVMDVEGLCPSATQYALLYAYRTLLT